MTIRKTPPSPPPSFNGLTPGAVMVETDAILDATAGLHDGLASTLTPSTANFVNLVRPLVDDANKAASHLRILSTLLSQLSPDPQVQAAARLAEQRIAAAQAKNLMRYDVAALVRAVHEKERTSPSGELDVQDQHLLSYVHGAYVRSGAELQGEAERERLRVALDELSAVRTAAQAAFNEEEDGIWFERKDLTGVPDDILAGMITDGSCIHVTFHKNHSTAVMRHATSSETRRRCLVAQQNRLPENVHRLAKVVVLRDEIARLLGFEHHAALKIEDKMAPSIAYVEAQLQELHTKLKPLAQAETMTLIKLKRKDPNLDEGSATQLYAWERSYYLHKQSKDSFSVDHALLVEDFEAGHTLQEMLSIFHDLFGIDFQRSETTVWHDSVVAYEVWDTPREGGEFLGWLYVDLFHRKGKYSGAHHVLVQPGFIEGSGKKHHPASALVCSFTNATQPRPTLLQHSEVKTMFHELGHAIHNLVARTKYSLPHSRDFIEIPSIMLENWIWIPDVLVRIGKHYTCLQNQDDTTKGALPRDLAESISRTRNKNRANAILAQIQPSLFDLAIHTPSTHAAALKLDTTEIWNRTKREVLTYDIGQNPQDWGAGQARFAHMFRKNDGSYFSYPLSMVYAADLFASTFSRDPMCPEVGRRYRYQVLEPGSGRQEKEILIDFLGREPSSQAIFDELLQ